VATFTVKVMLNRKSNCSAANEVYHIPVSVTIITVTNSYLSVFLLMSPYL